MSVGAIVELGFLDVHELLLGRCRSSVPGTGTITPLDAGKVFGLWSADALLNHPVCPQTLLRGADHTGDGGAPCDLWNQAFTVNNQTRL